MTHEARVLKLLSNRLSISTPQMEICSVRPLFTRHRKIGGDRLLPAQYAALTDKKKESLANDVAVFFCELQKISSEEVVALGPNPLTEWLPPADIVRKTEPHLPGYLRTFLHETVETYLALTAKGVEHVVGHFDCQGRNMAFDPENGRLNGIFDFADATVDDLYRELFSPNKLSRDFAMRVINRYQRISGRAVDVERVDLYMTMYCFSEMARWVSHDKTQLDRVAARYEQSRLGAGGSSAFALHRD